MVSYTLIEELHFLLFQIEKDHLNTLSAELQVTPILIHSVKDEEPVSTSEPEEKPPSHPVLDAVGSSVSVKEQELDSEKDQL